MSQVNKMDPYPYEFHKNLPVLRQTEQALISRVQVIMKCYRWKDGGFRYQGHVMNFKQDPRRIFSTLPFDFKDLPIVILRKKDAQHPNNYKDFRVRKEAIKVWLLFLIEHNSAYRDVTINEERLNSLPDRACVAARINTQYEEDSPTEQQKDCDDARDDQNCVEEQDNLDIEEVQEDMNAGPEHWSSRSF